MELERREQGKLNISPTGLAIMGALGVLIGMIVYILVIPGVWGAALIGVGLGFFISGTCEIYWNKKHECYDEEGNNLAT